MASAKSASDLPPGICRVGPDTWGLGPDFRPGMRVPIRIYASEALLHAMDAQVFEQSAHVAMLPGVVGASLCMPDAHWGYGFPIGGVAAMDPRSGVISPGGIGFDINCGMRLVRGSRRSWTGWPIASRRASGAPASSA